MTNKFQGFGTPKENWSKLPHLLIDELPRFETAAELKVVLYILRHTWGYQELEEGKRITLDEFENGRKRTDGTRIDNGVGMTRPSIVDGLKRALDHGFILVDIDDSDKARVKKDFRLRMTAQPKRNEGRNSGVKKFYPGVKKLNPSGQDSLHRSEKDTEERKPKPGSIPKPKDKPSLLDDPVIATIWQVWQADTKGQMTGENWSIWWGRAEPVAIKGETLVVAMPTQMTLEWVEHRLKAMATRSLEFASKGRFKEIEFVLAKGAVK